MSKETTAQWSFKAIFVWLICVNLLFAISEGFFAKDEELSLAKDEFALYEVEGKSLYFRWTLYINKGLVMHYAYDGFPYQNVLYTDYKRNGFKIKLKQSVDDHMEPPYFMVIFKEMNLEAKKADFSVHLYDPIGSIKLNRK